MDKKIIIAIIGGIALILAGFAQNPSLIDNLFEKPSETTDPQKITSTPDLTTTPVVADEGAQASTQSPLATSEKSYQQWWSEGDQLYSEGNFLGAIDCYNNAIELAPDNAELWNAKGSAFKEMGERYQSDSQYSQAKSEYEQAIQAYDEALKLSHYDFSDAQEGKDYCANQLNLLP